MYMPVKFNMFYISALFKHKPSKSTNKRKMIGTFQ